MMRQRIYFFLMSLCLIPSAYAYDVIGHRIVADIANQNLSHAAKQEIDNLLGKNGIVYLSTWADDIRNDSAYAYSYDWHFQDLPDDLAPNDLQNLWNNPTKDGKHLFYAIQTMIKRLKIDKNDAEALKFLIHFIGDLHQPFHLGREEDRGGNDIQTKWFGENIRVHQLWDKYLVEHQGYSYSEYSQYLKDKYEKEKSFYKESTLLQSIEQVYALRQKLYKYDYANMRYYMYDYTYKDKLNEMLYRAGIQLAKILNEIYD